VIVGLGKLGGNEAELSKPFGRPVSLRDEASRGRRSGWRRVERTANNHFFTQLAQRIIKQLRSTRPKAASMPSMSWLRPIGVGGALALSFADFTQHFASGAAPLWQWQALCQARAVFGDAPAVKAPARLLRQLLVERPRRDTDVAELRRSRLALERSASPHNLKRGPGGTLDIEFLVQMLQLRDAPRQARSADNQYPIGARALGAAGILSAEMAGRLSESYRFLRRVEAALPLARRTQAT